MTNEITATLELAINRFERSVRQHDRRMREPGLHFEVVQEYEAALQHLVNTIAKAIGGKEKQ